MKVMLVCNAGMSTGILAKRIEEASHGEIVCQAYGEAEYLDHMEEGYELLLIGPQIRHFKKTNREFCSNSCRCYRTAVLWCNERKSYL